MPRPSSSSPHQNIIIMLQDYARLQMSCELLHFTTTAFILLPFALSCRNTARPWFVRPVSVMLRQWLCAFSFCLHISFQPAKNKSSLGSKIIPMYLSVTFQLQQFSARDACHMQFFLSLHLAVRHYIVHRKQRSFDELTRHDIDGSLLPNNIVE